MSAGSVSSSSTLEIFRDASRLWWLLCPPVYLFGSFPLTSVCLGQYILMSLGWWMSRSNMLVWDFRSMFNFCSKLIAIYTAKGKYDPFSWFTNQVVSVIRSFWLAVQTMCRKLWLRGGQHWVLQRQVSMYTGILLLRQQQDLCGLWVVYIHLCGVCWCFTLSFCHWHTLLLHLLVFPPCYTL